MLFIHAPCMIVDVAQREVYGSPLWWLKQHSFSCNVNNEFLSLIPALDQHLENRSSVKIFFLNFRAAKIHFTTSAGEMSTSLSSKPIGSDSMIK